MNHILKTLRGTVLYKTHDEALKSIQEKAATLGDGQFCIASYKDGNEVKSLVSVTRNRSNIKGYTVFDVEESNVKTGDGFEKDDEGKLVLKLGNGLYFDANKKLSVKIATDSQSYLTLTENGLKLSGIDELKESIEQSVSENLEPRVKALEDGATKDVVSISAASVSSGNVELTGTTALKSTITVSGRNEYFNGTKTTIDTSKLSLYQGSTKVTLTNGKATVTLPTAANVSVNYTAKMEGSSTANESTLNFKMLTRIYARYDTATPSVDKFINSAAGNTSAAANSVASVIVTSVGQTLTIPVNGSGDNYVYFAVPSYLSVASGELPDSLNAAISITNTNATITKSLGGGTQTWKIYKTASTFPSNKTVKIKLK